MFKLVFVYKIEQTNSGIYLQDTEDGSLEFIICEELEDSNEEARTTLTFEEVQKLHYQLGKFLGV
jgi:hypothetical protein